MAKKLTAVLVDDELHNLQITEALLHEHCSNVEVLKTFTKPGQAVKFISTKKPDLLLLDIKMPKMNGFELIQEIEPYPFQIIFITAHSDFALKAIKFSALDYILKPINQDELKMAISKASKKKSETNPLLQLSQASQNMNFFNDNKDQKIAITTSNSIEYIDLNNLLCIKSDKNYSTLYFNNQKPLFVSKQIGLFEEILETKGFFRSHNSCLINLKKVIRYIKSEGGSIELETGILCPLSRNKKDEFFHLL